MPHVVLEVLGSDSIAVLLVSKNQDCAAQQKQQQRSKGGAIYAPHGCLCTLYI
jgi:hypothetical protein